MRKGRHAFRTFQLYSLGKNSRTCQINPRQKTERKLDGADLHVTEHIQHDRARYRDLCFGHGQRGKNKTIDKEKYIKIQIEVTGYGFNGVVAPDEIRNLYINKSVAHTKKRGAAQVIRYNL